MNLLRTAGRVAATALAVLAQTSAQTEGSAAGAPLLHVVGTQREWLSAAASLLGAAAPEAAAAVEVMLLADGTRLVRPRPADGAPLLQVEVRPSAWLAHEPEALARWQRTWSGRLVAAANGFGLPPSVARRVLPALVELLQGIECATATVVPGDSGFDLRLTAEARSATPLAAWLATLRPGPGPELRPPARALVSLELALAPECLEAAAAPFVPWIAALGADDAELAAITTDLQARLTLLDGGATVAFAPPHLVFACGLRNPAAWTRLTTDPERLAAERTRLAARDIVAEYEPAAVVVRDVPLLRSRVRGRGPVPVLGDAAGELVTFGGVVRRTWLQVGGGDDPLAFLRTLLAGAEVPTPARDSAALVRLDLDVAGILALVRGQAPAAGAGAAQAPRRAAVVVTSGERRLELRAALR